MISAKQLIHMFTLQRQFNNGAIGHDWQDLSTPFTIAAMRELGEALGALEYNWVWWKESPVPEGYDTMAWIEIIDALHFTISEHISYDPGKAARDINAWHDLAVQGAEEEGFNPTEKKEDAIVDVMGQIGCGADAVRAYSCYGLLCAAFGRKPEELYKWYIGKNVLNQFRQDHGYKEGRYSRKWDGVDDNLVLARLLENIEANEDTYKNVKDALTEAYRETHK